MQKQNAGELTQERLEELQDQYGFDDSHTIEVVEAFLNCFNEEDLGDLDDMYVGYWYSQEDFAQEQAEELVFGRGESQGWPYYCIDWEWAARELMHDYSEDGGHYFRYV